MQEFFEVNKVPEFMMIHYRGLELCLQFDFVNINQQ